LLSFSWCLLFSPHRKLILNILTFIHSLPWKRSQSLTEASFARCRRFCQACSLAGNAPSPFKTIECLFFFFFFFLVLPKEPSSDALSSLHFRAGPAESLEHLRESGITHIIQVTDVATPRFPGHFMYKIITVPDMDETNLIKHFPDTYTFIYQALEKGGKVLVHW